MLVALTFSALFLFQGTAGQNGVTIDSVKQAFLQDRIVPDVLPSFEPTGLLDVAFTDSAASQKVDVTPGIDLTREQTINRPQIGLTSFPSSLMNQTFVLAMVDPDAPFPSNRSSAQVRHLLGGDFKLNGAASDNRALLVNSSSLISEYRRPSPPQGSPPHRYVLLLYIQPDNFAAASAALVNSTTPVAKFNITTFAQAVGLGSPVAATYFKTGPDKDSLPAGGTLSSPGKNAASRVNLVSAAAFFGFIIAVIFVHLG